LKRQLQFNRLPWIAITIDKGYINNSLMNTFYIEIEIEIEVSSGMSRHFNNQIVSAFIGEEA
jgi:hypothetical protein